MLVPLLSLVAAWHSPAKPVQLAGGSRRVVAAPQLNFVTPELSANPVSFLVLGFGLSWTLSITSKSFRESELVQSGNKMRSMKKEPPKVRGVKLVPNARAITEGFAVSYPERELELLWGALLKVYGDEAKALQAARDNPQILNPAYSFCNTILESKRMLVRVMSEAEALEVMQQNPAVLQCGPTLEALGAGEIKAFAQLRGAGNTLIPQQVRGPAVATFVTAVAFVILTTGTETPEVLATRDALRPVLGSVLASSFLFTAFSAAKSS